MKNTWTAVIRSVALPGFGAGTAARRSSPCFYLIWCGARDVISQCDGLRAYCRQSSFVASLFLQYLERNFPFKIKAIQIDGSSEFKKRFKQACRYRGIFLFVLPPNSPKLNGHVERANRTHREDFYEVEEIELTLLEDDNKQEMGICL